MVREPGDWPGRDLVEQITSLFQVVTLLAFVSALFLVANTMNTLIAEQAAEIAVMKAIGGRRRQVASVFVRSALLVGVAGAVLGTVLGVGVASALAGYFTDMFGVPGGLAVDGPMVVATLVIGPLVAVLATLPALRRGLRRPVAAGLDDRGVAAGFGARPHRPRGGPGGLPAARRPAGAAQRAAPAPALGRHGGPAHPRGGRRARRSSASAARSGPRSTTCTTTSTSTWWSRPTTAPRPSTPPPAARSRASTAWRTPPRCSSARSSTRNPRR